MSQESVHANHILPLKIYLIIGGSLLALTGITVYIASLDFGAMNLLVALGIATLKATLVGMYFMHLKYDNKLYATMFLLSIIFLGLFIVFTMFDTMRRDDINPERSQHVKPNAEIYDNVNKTEAPSHTSEPAKSEEQSDTETADKTDSH